MFLQRRAQVTLIVILGIMLVIIFIFMLSLKGNSIQNNGWDQNKVLYELQSGVLKEHVNDCISSITADGVEFLGQNGGYIYDFEGGKIPLQSLVGGINYIDYYTGSKKNLVSYGLRENIRCSQISYDHPTYPLISNSNTIFSNLSNVYSSDDSCYYGYQGSEYDGVFGEITLPKLCAADGTSSCRSFARGNIIGFTIENQLEDYVNSKLPTCVDFSDFEDNIDGEITLDGVAKADVIVRDDDVFVKATYPFKITYRNSAPSVQVLEYSSYEKVRLGSIYNYIYDVLSKEARDPFFNLNKTPYASNFFKEGFVFKKIDRACPTCDFPENKDAVVEVYDTKSVVRGKSFLFRTAVQNRRPILQYIGNRNYDLSSDLPVEDRSVGSNISIFAIDPDDSDLTYEFLSDGYSPGWRENEDVWFLTPVESVLSIYLKVINDYGKHPVAVLVKDSEGFFDYEWFNITVIDNTLDSEVSSDCVHECSGTGLNINCNQWCWIAANSCKSFCQNEFFREDSECNLCANTAYYSIDKENHLNCKNLAEDVCKQNSPDCFWITQKLDSDVVESKCFNDFDLSNVAKYSVIN